MLVGSSCFSNSIYCRSLCGVNGHARRDAEKSVSDTERSHGSCRLILAQIPYAIWLKMLGLNCEDADRKME